MSEPATSLLNKIWVTSPTVVKTGASYAMVNDGIVVVNKTSGSATAVTLTPHPSAGMFAIVKDGKGDAASHNITISPTSGTVDGASTFVIKENYDCAIFHYSGTEWNILTGFGGEDAYKAAISATTVSAGQSGTAGTLQVYPSTAATGVTTFTAAANSGNTTTNINTALQGGARTYTVPDAGGSASFLMSVGRAQAQLLAVGPAPTDTYSATMTIDVTKSLHVISAVNGTSATVTFTPSAAGSAGDILTIISEADGSGTVTATFASTFHSSGTQATTASHFSSIVFQSDGTRWVEVCRTTNLA